MGQACLRCPVSSCDSSFDSGDSLHDSLFPKDILAQTECVRVEVEISIGRRVEAGAVGRPLYVVECRSWDTELCRALVICIWRVESHITVIGLRRATDESRRTSPGGIGA